MQLKSVKKTSKTQVQNNLELLRPQRLAAIDVGSNAIRLAIAEASPSGELRLLKKHREGVRLGKDVFSSGRLSPKTITRSLETFVKFKSFIKEYGVTRVRAVGTSALREALNAPELIAPIRKLTSIDLEIIDGLQEGKLIFQAIADRIDLSQKRVLSIDIGGGSVEFSATLGSTIEQTRSFPLGGVRLLEQLKQRNLKDRHLKDVIQELFIPARAFLRECMRSGHRFDFAVGTGGNFEALARLRVSLLSKTNLHTMTRAELFEVTTHLASMTLKERVRYLKLKEDRADVIVPAALLTLEVLDTVAANQLYVPFVGLREGLLSSIVAESKGSQTRASAPHLGQQ